MASSPPALPESASLDQRMTALGTALGEREAAHGDGLGAARACAERLRGEVEAALASFHAAAAAAGAPHLRVELSPVRTDDKHLRSVEFDLTRGRYRAIITAKSRGDVTFVGPFRSGKTEGPCKSFPFDTGDELQANLARFLESFLEEAATP
ncbi:MAG: hypothetical protein AAF430_07670 [Myxococcota bacterium]